MNPEQIEGAVVERFLATSGTIPEIALEFGISEARVRASIPCRSSSHTAACS